MPSMLRASIAVLLQGAGPSVRTGLKAHFFYPCGNIVPRPGPWCSLFAKVNAMEEGDVRASHPAVPCALLSGRTTGKVRIWGFWSRLRWYLLG